MSKKIQGDKLHATDKMISIISLRSNYRYLRKFLKPKNPYLSNNASETMIQRHSKVIQEVHGKKRLKRVYFGAQNF